MHKKPEYNFNLGIMLTHFLPEIRNRNIGKRVYQKSHYQIARRIWIIDFDQSVEGLKVIFHNNK